MKDEAEILGHKLDESERRFRLLIDGVRDYAIFMLDRNGLITNWNKGAERIKGWAAHEVVGRHFGLFYPDADREAGLPSRALEIALTQGRYETEGWRIRKDGSRFWAAVVLEPIFDDGTHIGFAKVTRDVSERRAAEHKIMESEREFRLLVSSVVDYALYMLDPNGIVTTWNVGAERIKGYAPDEIVGRHFSTFYTDADRAQDVPARMLARAAEEGRADAEGWRVRKDGSLFWASVVIDAIRDDHGQLIGFAKITRDITERREAELQMQKMQAQLAQVQKMEALGQLTGGVAHDFNNLLMVVSGRVQMLRRKLKDMPEIAPDLDAIEASSKRGAVLTRHLLAFARRQRLQPASLALSSKVSAFETLLGAAMPGGVKVRVELSEALWPVEVDANELELSLLNLAVNARDAMPSGGELIVSAANVELKPTDIDPDLSGPFVAITVRDTGSGIAPDILPKIFEPFFTTKQVDKGTGLGLAQVYGFASQSGGRVTAESELGKGTAVTLYLPRATSDATAPQQTAAPSGEASAARILVVEDNPEVAEVAAALLQQLGNRARVATSAALALEALKDDEDIDLVFTDVVMAGEMDGLALARRIRELRPDLPVVLTTGYAHALASSDVEFPVLRKPYHLADLNRVIGSQLERKRAEPGDKLVDLNQARRGRKQKIEAT